MDGQVFMNVPSLKSFLEVLVSSFRNNSDLIEFIDNVCGGNVRLALEFIKVFIGSGHVDTHKIIAIYQEEGDIRFHFTSSCAQSCMETTIGMIQMRLRSRTCSIFLREWQRTLHYIVCSRIRRTSRSTV